MCASHARYSPPLQPATRRLNSGWALSVCGRGVSGMRRGEMVPTLLLVGGPAAAVCNGTVSVVVANPVVVVVHGSQNGESRIARTRTSKRFRKTLMWNRFSLIPTEPIGTNQGPNRLLPSSVCATQYIHRPQRAPRYNSVIICLNYSIETMHYNAEPVLSAMKIGYEYRGSGRYAPEERSACNSM